MVNTYTIMINMYGKVSCFLQSCFHDKVLDPFFSCLLRLQESPPYSPSVYCLHPREVLARHQNCEVFPIDLISCVNHLEFVNLFKATLTCFIVFCTSFSLIC